MAKKEVEERELTGGEIVVAAIILILNSVSGVLKGYFHLHFFQQYVLLLILSMKTF